MPNPLRVTMFFDDGISGWTETHYDVKSASLLAALQLAVFPGGLVNARTNLMACGPWLKYVRTSYDGVFRDSRVFLTPQPPVNSQGTYVNNPAYNVQGLSPIATITEAGNPFYSVLLRAQSGDLYRKAIYVSGVDYNYIRDNSSILNSPIFTQSAFEYTAVLTANYGFPVWQRDTQTYPQFQITAIGAAPNYTLTVPGFPGLAGSGYRAYISQFRYGYPSRVKFNGPYGIVSSAGGQVQLAGFTVPTGVTFVSGQIQLQAKGVVPYTSVTIERVTHRKRGRPFDSPRGRTRRSSSVRAY